MFNLLHWILPSIFSTYLRLSLGSVGAVVGIASGVNGLLGGGSSTSSGNVAGGAAYDPYAAYRGKAATTLDSLIYGSPGTSSTGSGGSGQTYQQYLQGFNGGQSGSVPSVSWNTPYSQIVAMGGQDPHASGGGGSSGTPLTEAQWQAQQGSGSTGGGSPTDIIKGMPGYQFGMNQGVDTLNRTMAQTGQVQSGAQQVGLSEFGQQYAGSFYDKMVNNLMGMSGATQSPMNVTSQNALNNTTSNQGWSAISQGLNGLSNTFNNNGNTYNPSVGMVTGNTTEAFPGAGPGSGA